MHIYNELDLHRKECVCAEKMTMTSFEYSRRSAISAHLVAG